MRAAVLVVIAALAAGCYTNAFSNAAKEKALQRKALAKAAPARLEVGTPVPGLARAAYVRVWADEDYRSQNVRWRAQIEELLDEASQFLVPAVGVKLVAKEIVPWNARSSGVTPGEALAALEALDDGDDVDWVIGCVSALSIVEGSLEQLGVARPLGRHVVVRGYADLAEQSEFERLYPDTSAEARGRVQQARRRHKQVVVLLHELWHTLGAPHETDPSWLMSGMYSLEMATVSDPSRAIAQLTLETWLKPREQFDARALAARINGYFDANPWGGWDADSLGEMQAQLRVMLEQRGGGGSSGGAMLTGEAQEQFLRARRLAQAGQLADALAELDALVAAYPATPDVRLAICELRVAADGPTAESTTKACSRARDLVPDDPRPLLMIAVALLAKGDRVAGLERLAAIETMAGSRAEVWASLAQLYMGQGLVTHAERAATAVEGAVPGAGADVLGWASRTRGRYGLPPGGKPGSIALADEGDYVAAVRELLDLVYANKFAEAKKRAAAVDKRWRGAPGVLAARCDLELRQNALGKARALCDQAIAAWSGAAWALYLRGVILTRGKQLKPAIESLRAAIAAEPTLAQAYRALGQALDRAGDRDGKAALAVDYQQRFGARLP